MAMRNKVTLIDEKGFKNLFLSLTWIFLKVIDKSEHFSGYFPFNERR